MCHDKTRLDHTESMQSQLKTKYKEKNVLTTKLDRFLDLLLKIVASNSNLHDHFIASEIGFIFKRRQISTCITKFMCQSQCKRDLTLVFCESLFFTLNLHFDCKYAI